jgi:hypothetical protein
MFAPVKMIQALQVMGIDQYEFIKVMMFVSVNKWGRDYVRSHLLDG